MDPNQETDNFGDAADAVEIDATLSVDDFIKELEAKEKDLHITAETSIIEIAESFGEGEEMPESLVRLLERNRDPRPTRRGADGPDTAELESQISTLEKKNAEYSEKIASLESERVESFKDTQRRARDFENYRTRTERERTESYQVQVGNLATQMLPALDNLERALKFSAEILDDERGPVRQFFDGIVLVSKQINEVLANMGIVPIETIGEKFDPHYHEAVAAEPSEHPANIVIAEVLRGYRIGDRVVRHSMVTVSMGPGDDLAESGYAEEAVETAAGPTPETEDPKGSFDPRIERF